MTLDQIWLLPRGLRSLRSEQAARQCLAFGSAVKLVNSAVSFQNAVLIIFMIDYIYGDS